MRKSDEDWVKKCMEFRVKGRRPTGRSRRTCLECRCGSPTLSENGLQTDNIYKDERSPFLCVCVHLYYFCKNFACMLCV